MDGSESICKGLQTHKGTVFERQKLNKYFFFLYTHRINSNENKKGRKEGRKGKKGKIKTKGRQWHELKLRKKHINISIINLRVKQL